MANTDEGFWDDAFGSVDESVARTTDDKAAGGLIDGALGSVDESFSDEGATQEMQEGDVGSIVDGGADIALWKTDEWFSTTALGDPVDAAKDTVGSGHEDDTVDLWGPTAWGTEGSTLDWLTNDASESGTKANPKLFGIQLRWVLVLAAGLYGLSILNDSAQIATGN